MKALIIFVILLINSSLFANECIQRIDDFLIKQKLLTIGEAIGARGLVANSGQITGPMVSQAYNFGLIDWGLKIFHATSIEEARAHDQALTNLLMKGAYIIGPKGYPENYEALAEAITLFKDYSKNHFIWFKNGEIQTISENTTKNLFPFNENSLFFNEKNPKDTFLYQEGFFFTEERGVIFFDELKKSKSILKYAQQVYDAGYKVTFNQHFEAVLDKLRSQPRKDQHEADNLFAKVNGEESTAMKNLLEQHALGQVITTEITDPNGKLIAGSVSVKRDTFITSNTVFYDNEATAPEGVTVSKEATKPINLAKIANWALSEKLGDSGVSFFDIGMVSGFSSQTRGRLISRKEFAELIFKNSKSEIQALDFSSEWIPPKKR